MELFNYEAETSSNNNCDIEDSLLQNNGGRRKLKHRPCLCSNHKISITIIVVILFLAFSVIFVDFPLVFMHSIKLQRKVLFSPSESLPEEFINVGKYANGIRNFYITVNETANITLGIWHLLPEALINNSVEKQNFNYSRSLAQHNYPILLHFHDNSGNRIYNTKIYLKLRKFFHVIGFDYRSFGDSSKAELTEEGIVQDSVELYKWLRSQTSPDNIYVWGNSLGAALATHTLAKLRDGNITSMGLILEAPFTTLREEAENFWVAKSFSWLPWFGMTILDGFERNGFYFRTSENILKVDCPIMILHAEDDRSVPYTLGKKLYKIAQEKRDPKSQGNITFHGFPAKVNYKHWGITDAPALLNYVRYHISICEIYNKTKSVLKCSKIKD